MADDNRSDFELALNILETDFAGDAPATGGSLEKNEDGAAVLADPPTDEVDDSKVRCCS
jgi:hypothetical protein